MVKCERQVGIFASISANADLEVFLIQNSEVKVDVEADDNLQDIIKTEVSNGELKIYTEKPIGHAIAKRVYVSFKTIHSLKASPGSSIKSKMELKLNSLNLSASSGANLKLYASEKIVAKASSGGNIRVGGNPNERNVEKSSGGDVSFK